MNGAALDHDTFEPDPSVPFPGLVLIGLCLVGWAAFVGAGYCIYQAWEAVAG